MFANRSIRLLLLASTAIPATLAFGASKMTAPSTAAEMQEQLAAPALPGQAAPAAVNCGDINTGTVGWVSKDVALQKLKGDLDSLCKANGCVIDDQSLQTQYQPPSPGSTVSQQMGGSWNASGKCKKKLMAAPAPAPMNPKPPADVQLQAE